MSNLRYPIGIQSFSEIREGGYIYIDKTEYIYRLIAEGKYYFLSRPRRFGKSLLLSTIEEYFKGNREFFNGLAISKHDHTWDKYPVLHLDLSGCTIDSHDRLPSFIEDFLSRWENEYDIPTNHDIPYSLRFKEIIIQAHQQTGNQVVILVDEYDKPILETVGNPTLQEKCRNILRSFYSNLKSQDRHIKFAMLTGVTRFGQLSIFSDLNNLKDISLNKKYSGICGITAEELHKYFDKGIEDFATSLNTTKEEIYNLLKENYDGYRFSPTDTTEIYNPFSVLNSISDESFDNYWFKTGTPSFLVRLIKFNKFPLQELTDYETTTSQLTDVSLELTDIVPVLYQSGYLTIKSHDTRLNTVTLDFPNKEVESGFLNQLMPLYTPIPSQKTEFEIIRFVKEIEKGDVGSFMVRLQSLFSDFQYDSFDLKHLEQHYQDVVFILAKLLGFYTRIEYQTSSGRIDLVITTDNYIYLFEFKIDKSAEEAINQITRNHYPIPFKADSRRIIGIGANFSSRTRSLDSWIIKDL